MILTFLVFTFLFDDDSCQYGDGFFKVVDGKSGATVYESDSSFLTYMQARFQVKNDGTIEFLRETTDYENSWEGAEEVKNYPQNVDQAWPGPKPGDKGSLNINVKFDRFPEDDTWELSQYNDGSWDTMETFDGNSGGAHNDLVSTQLTGLEPNWYKFSMRDANGDGICCEYRRGWVAVTGYLLATRRSGLVWGSNGEFGDGFDLYLQINSAGMVNRISYDEPAIA